MANRIFVIINLLLITAGVYFGVSTIYAILTARMDFDTPSVQPMDRKAAVAAPAYTPPPRSNYQAIVDRNIFNSGTAAVTESESVQADLQLDKLEETKLNLKLWGTVAGPSRRAYAVIEDTKTRRQSLYHPGDTIQNATIKMVLRQKVVLTVEGRDEILAMQEPGQKSSPARGGVARASGASSALAPTPRLPVSARPREIAVKSEHIAEAMENIGDLMNQATFRPHIENGQPAGISITRIKPNAIFRRLRLRNGDIITGVNGSPIESVEDAVRVFETISDTTNIQLDIKRRGREQTLEYRIE
jgi:general secretion pathway protein C